MASEQTLSFGQRLKQIRISKNLSQTTLSKCTGFAQTTISDWENSRYFPNVLEAKRIAIALNVTLEELIGLDPDSSSIQIVKGGDV